MSHMNHAQLMRRYIKADPSMERDLRAVCNELGFSPNQEMMLRHIFDLDNAYADPHDGEISVVMLEAWCLLIGAMRRKNRDEAAMLKDTLDDIRLAIASKKEHGG